MNYPYSSAIISPIRPLEATNMAGVACVADHPDIPRMLPGAPGKVVFRVLIAGDIDSIREAAPEAFKSYRGCMEANQ